MKKYECVPCGYIYDEAAGDPDNGIAPGTKWEDLPEDWVCPVCEFSERQRNGDGWGFVYEKRRENPKNALISRYSTQNRREIVKEVVTL